MSGRKQGKQSGQPRRKKLTQAQRKAASAAKARQPKTYEELLKQQTVSIAAAFANNIPLNTIVTETSIAAKAFATRTKDHRVCGDAWVYNEEDENNTPNITLSFKLGDAPQAPQRTAIEQYLVGRFEQYQALNWGTIQTPTEGIFMPIHKTAMPQTPGSNSQHDIFPPCVCKSPALTFFTTSNEWRASEVDSIIPTKYYYEAFLVKEPFPIFDKHFQITTQISRRANLDSDGNPQLNRAQYTISYDENWDINLLLAIAIRNFSHPREATLFLSYMMVKCCSFFHGSEFMSRALYNGFQQYAQQRHADDATMQLHDLPEDFAWWCLPRDFNEFKQLANTPSHAPQAASASMTGGGGAGRGKTTATGLRRRAVQAKTTGSGGRRRARLRASDDNPEQPDNPEPKPKSGICCFTRCC